MDTEVIPNTIYSYRLETINHFGASADAYFVSVTALPLGPTVPTSGISFSNVGATSMTVTLTPGDGSHRLAVMKAGGPPDFQPVNNNTYSGNLGNGQSVAFNGTDSSFTLTGLQPDTQYFIKIYEFNTDSVSTSYLLDNAPMASARTVSEQTTLLRLYGMAFKGGAFGAGTVFKANEDGTGLTTLHDFNHLDGDSPYGSLIQVADGTIFGMTTQGGTSPFPHGVIFKMKADGTDYTVIHEFSTETGDNPFGSLMQTADGFLMGTTIGGGAFGYGTIFKLRTDGSNYSVIHSFSQSEGYIPRCRLLQGADGVLYGMTPWGGSKVFGTIFKVNTDGTDFRVLHNFSREIPQGSFVQAPDGTLLGTTTEGGLFGVGTIFRINPDGSDYSTLFDFNNLNGRFPTSTLTLGDSSTIYGTTDAGGPFFENGGAESQGGGTIFKINLDGSGHTILHSFVTPTGSSPQGGSLVLHDNKLYGYTSAGGNHNGGVIYYYDLSTSVYNKLADLSDSTGTSPSFGSLLLLHPIVAPYGVQNFSVVDVRTGNKLSDFDNSVLLDVGHDHFKYQTIRANTFPDSVGSILFRLNGRKINTDNQTPYLLKGHSLYLLDKGRHSLVAEVYPERSGKGPKQQSRHASIKLVNNTAVAGLNLIDQFGRKIQTLQDGDTLDAGDIRWANMNIEALLNRSAIHGSVKFFLNRVPYQVENKAPYVMFSHKRGWWAKPGVYTVRAIPYSKKNGKGVSGTSLTVTFTIRKTEVAARQTVSIGTSNEKTSVKIYPVPANDVLNIFVDDDGDESMAYVIIRNIHGQVHFSGFMLITSEPSKLDLEGLGLAKGIYFLQVRSATMNTSVRFIKE